MGPGPLSGSPEGVDEGGRGRGGARVQRNTKELQTARSLGHEVGEDGEMKRKGREGNGVVRLRKYSGDGEEGGRNRNV